MRLTPGSGSALDASPEALLNRPLRIIDTEAGLGLLRGRSVLVTGAAGSVGSALVQRLTRAGVDRVIALDHHEASLFRLGRDLAQEGGGAPIEPRLADVRNEAKVRRILEETRPAAVFHLAAYKHVPLGEREPDEVVSVNVLGTMAVARAAAAAGVHHFVYPSSDKAVNPPSIYGATKRVAESALLAIATPDAMAVHVVRYVNILGTSGSVVETFARQAREGLSLTLTDPRMTRYWMAMDEATAMLVHAVALPTGSCTLLDVGAAIPVPAMAERVFRLVRGDGTAPEIAITGTRPGERLAEELLSESEQLTASGEDPAMRVVHSRRDACALRMPAIVEELAGLVAAGETTALRARAMELARELQ